MRFYLISDNTDTFVGMRLAGIKGVIAHEKEEVKKALYEAVEMDDVVVILITEKLIKICDDVIYELKTTCKKPLIVEIPDRHGGGRAKDSITKYVRDAIGVKI